MSYATDFLRFTGIASKYPAGSWFTVAQDHGSYSFAHPTIVRWGIPGNYIAGNLTGAGTVDRSVLGAGTIPSYAGFELQAQDVTFASLNTKLMLIGDSITGFYVNDLSEAITSDAAGFHNVSFIGNNGNPPTDNNGYGGYVTEDLLNPAGTGTKGGSGLYNGDAGDLVNWMAGMAPDLILLHIGTNNSGNATTTISAYTLILNAARARNPGVKFFVSKIIPAAGNPSWSTTLNPMIAAWASANSTTQSPVITVDQYSGFDPSVYDASSNPTGMTRDGTHPTSVYANDTQPKTLTGGYHMAHAALEVLRPYLPSAGGVTLTVGEFVWWPLPAGQVGQIQVQRNGVDIPPVTAVIGGITQTVSPSLSAAQVGAFQYKVAAADIGTLGSPVALTARVIGAAYVTNAPRVYRVEIPLSNPNQIWITYDEGLDSTLPATSDYALAGTMATSKTLTSIALRATAGVYNIVVLTCSSAFVPGDLPLLSYTPGTHPLRDLAHTPNNALAFTSIGVWNNYPVPAEPVILKGSETNYTAASGGFVNTNGGGFYGFAPTLASFLPAHPSDTSHQAVLNADGWVEMQVIDSNAVIRQVGFGSAALDHLTYCADVRGGVLQAKAASTAVGAAHTFASPSTLCRARVFRDYPSGTVTVDYSEDGAVSWTTLYTYPSADISQLGAALFTASATVPIFGGALSGFTDLGY